MTQKKKEFKLAMLGMVEGNAHPYSWSAIINGDYDKKEMENCGYAGISVYLGQQPAEKLGIDGARVTHVWTDDPADAEQIAKAVYLDNVMEKDTDCIGEVDAVVISTDKGFEHVDRARPFVEAGLPVFIDKPMVDNEEDLTTFNNWVKEGRQILSSSAMRYSKGITPYHQNTYEIGEVRFACVPMAKKWETYGIHAAEAIYPILGPGFVSVRNTGTYERNVVHLKHEDGIDVVIPTTKDMFGAFGNIMICGTQGTLNLQSRDTFNTFKAQLQSFVDFLHTGERPFPWSETVELMRIIIAGIKSREQDGKEIFLKDVAPKV
ncbi:MAG: Gfo/Idh/MocA family oxidoreductase [Clostridia bacterium]|nr:Gfo/Idh/MocA family oxidoreductase [Clostridia bacterium]